MIGTNCWDYFERLWKLQGVGDTLEEVVTWGRFIGPYCHLPLPALFSDFFCCPWSEHGQQKETLLHHPLPELKCLGPNDTRLTSLKPLIKNNFPLLSYLFQDFSHSVERLTTALHIRQTTWTNKTCFSTDTTTRLHIILFPRAWIIVLLKAVDIGVYNEWGWKCCRALLCWQTTGRNVKV